MGNFIQLGFNENKKGPTHWMETIEAARLLLYTGVLFSRRLRFATAPALSQFFLSHGQTDSQVDASFGLAFSLRSISLGHPHRRLALTLVELKFGRK